MQSSRVLITGGAGFIGSHLAESLLEQGNRVHVVDDLSTGSIANLDSIREHPGFSYTISDVRDQPVMAELVDRADVIYHLAAAVGVKLIVENPVHTIETNIGCTEMVLKLANKKGKKVILASTSEVYGKNNTAPFKEDTSDVVLGPTVKARWAYACTKAIDEFLALAYHQARGLPVVIVRLFNTVGPRQTGRYGMVLPTFVRQALMGRDITVFDTGEQTRCFSYVGDVIKALIALTDCEKALGQVVNIGGRQEISINRLAELVKERTASESELVHIPYDQAYAEGFEDMARRLPDVSKLESLVGFAPDRDITDIIDRVVEFYRQR